MGGNRCGLTRTDVIRGPVRQPAISSDGSKVATSPA
jgi:hypothetical protein